MKTTKFAVAAALLIGTASACTLNTDVSGPGGLLRHGGDEQSAAVNTDLPEPLAVMVVTQFGEPIDGATVNWSIVSGGGTLSSNVTITDVTGVATVNYTTGPTTGDVTIRAQVHGVPPLTFHVHVT
ncbi:MAG TPA: Ig-like domain-containing protein [Gemmatimonadaceae bacterium]|nr:Ig-like domain-containing protein [Gemmatimonadaceae bacterium]